MDDSNQGQKEKILAALREAGNTGATYDELHERTGVPRRNIPAVIQRLSNIRRQQEGKSKRVFLDSGGRDRLSEEARKALRALDFVRRKIESGETAARVEEFNPTQGVFYVEEGSWPNGDSDYLPGPWSGKLVITFGAPRQHN